MTWRGWEDYRPPVAREARVPDTPAPAPAPRPHKYGAEAIGVDGFRFDSKREAARYQELLFRLRAGEIDSLEVHPTFALEVNGLLIATYEADFRYREIATGRVVVEDVKGVRTPVYRLKRKLMQAIHGIAIVEV